MISYHSSLGVLGGRRSSSTASATRGVRARRAAERRLRGAGRPARGSHPHDAGPGRHTYAAQSAHRDRGIRTVPRKGSPYCRKAAKEGVVSSAWTPMVSRLTRELGRPVRILKVLGLRSDEGADRKKRPAFRTVQANSARIVDEWLPVKDWTTDAVKEWHAGAPVPYCWTYDSVPGAGDWLGSSRHVDRTTGGDTRVSCVFRSAASIGSHATRLEGSAWRCRVMWSAISTRSGSRGGAGWWRSTVSCRTRYRTPTDSRSSPYAGTCVTSSPRAAVWEAYGATPTTCCGGGGGFWSSTLSGTR